MSDSELRSPLVPLLRRAPWAAAARRDVLFVAAGVPLGLPTLLVLLDAKSALVLLLLLPFCSDLLTTAQRSRLRVLRDVDVPSRLPPDAGWARRLRAGMTWRQTLYHGFVAPLFATAGLLVMAVWGAGLVMATLFAWIWAMPPDGPLRPGAGWTTDGGWITAAGAALLFFAPWAFAWIARTDERTARTLLGRNRAEVLEERVERLAVSRAGVVDAADAERRRIERDLHDGAQQRLVSLAMNLGLARRTLTDIPPEAMQVIAEAHEEAQAAIEELRDLVRGLHPVVLEDRGLDAALSGIAARSPVPVRMNVDLQGRVAPAVEAVAYFTVSEALTNAAKHARASRVELSVRRVGDRLRIVVGDDGIGGADPSRGSGLTGLRKRAASVDGTLTVISPLGGPTTLTVELPCEL
ncbi:sensor histidine kinase [Kitasatospora sp. DSM 101779]|uniref:sensor histidine kinase n=1 Tax=Kitasatospora sp. DSM 101779 TaxID=2853165 RepID=UPI0021D91FAC|nr:sensor histidine kinase [Kitasatospora sp. DSM 101779]MCU7824903.1 sensor histidine kinase [Kitasatospora sp. DSM 101779]